MFTVMHAIRNICKQMHAKCIHLYTYECAERGTQEHERSLIIETKYAQIHVFAEMHVTCTYANTCIMHTHTQPVYLQIVTSKIMWAHLVPKNEKNCMYIYMNTQTQIVLCMSNIRNTCSDAYHTNMCTQTFMQCLYANKDMMKKNQKKKTLKA